MTWSNFIVARIRVTQSLLFLQDYFKELRILIVLVGSMFLKQCWNREMIVKDLPQLIASPYNLKDFWRLRGEKSIARYRCWTALSWQLLCNALLPHTAAIPGVLQALVSLVGCSSEVNILCFAIAELVRMTGSHKHCKCIISASSPHPLPQCNVSFLELTQKHLLPAALLELWKI